MAYIASLLTRAPQYFTITITSGNTVATQGFTGANGTVILEHLGNHGGANSLATGLCRVSYAGTTITATRNTASTDSCIVDCVVYHVNPKFIISTENIVVNLDGITTNTQVVTAVSKGWIIRQGTITDDTTHSGLVFSISSLILDDSTHVRGNRSSNVSNWTEYGLLVGLK